MIKNTHPGKFITFEGLDGSGQSTQVELLEKFLNEKGLPTVKTKEPTLNSKVGKELREILDKQKEASFQKIQELFAEDRKEHLENFIIPNLEKGINVICDRYFFTAFAFGSINLDLDWLIEINDDFLMPDVAFFLDVGPKTCLRRIEERNKKKTLFENREKLKKAYQNFKEIVKKFSSLKSINGEKPIKEVFEEIKIEVKNHLPQI